MTLAFTSAYLLLIAAALILLGSASALRRKGYLTILERVGIVAGIVSLVFGAITFFLGNDIMLPFLWRGVILGAGICVILLSIFIPRRAHAPHPILPERESSTASAEVLEQTPSLTYGKIVLQRRTEEQHGGTYRDSDFLLRIQNTTPNTVALNCEAIFDLHNNAETGLWNRNDSPRISIGHSELLKLFTVSFFYTGNRRVDTKLHFYMSSDIEGVLNYFDIHYGENLNRELRVLLQSTNAQYPPAAEAFNRTIQYIMDNAVEE